MWRPSWKGKPLPIYQCNDPAPDADGVGGFPCDAGGVGVNPDLRGGRCSEDGALTLTLRLLVGFGGGRAGKNLTEQAKSCSVAPR